MTKIQELILDNQLAIMRSLNELMALECVSCDDLLLDRCSLTEEFLEYARQEE